MEPVERSPSSWRLPDTAAFHAWVVKEFAYSREDAKQLMVQQRFVRDFLQRASPYRGLLLYHGLGSGKTCTAIAASAHDDGGGGKLFVMLPASLRSNYVKELRKCGGRRVRETQSWSKVGVEWVSDDDHGTPFDRLSAHDRQELRAQLDDRINRYVRFVNYNGLNSKRVTELCQTGAGNPFDDAVIVVDEVHNFVSSVSNGGLLSRVYDRLMEASRCKILLLSGTPLVNEPHELALLVNLAGGYLATHEFSLRGGLDDRTSAQLSACPAVHAFRDTVGRSGHPVVEVRLVPDGFRRTDGRMVARAPDADGVRMVREILSFGPGIVGNPRRRQSTLLPAGPDVFRRHFVTDDFDIANAQVLARRMSGTVSFFRGHAPALYPRLRSMLLVRTAMSARQFSEYTIQRTIEVKREEKARQIAGIRKQSAGSSAAVDGVAGYRPLSRAVCNFAFPDDVPRPQRKGGRGERGEGGDDGANDSYERALDEAAQKLRANPTALTVGAGLSELSPKFNAIVEHLLLGNTARTASRANDVDAPVDAPRPPSSRRRPRGELRGTAIVYSERRRAEGINLLAAALDVNGFCEFSVVRNVDGELEVAPSVAPDKPRYVVYNNDDADVAACMLSVFNNQMKDVPETVLRGLRGMGLDTNLRGEIVRALLITKSGAEGITTRNVREVHIVEPFWHANRIEQVVGRARRAYSHDDLPSAERTVDVFIYMATFDAEQAKIHKKDDGKTSDEYVHDVSQRKRKVLQKLYRLMRAGSVDCGLYGVDPDTECVAAPADAGPDDLVYNVDLDADVATSEVGESRLVLVQGDDGALYYADPKSGKLYDHASIKKSGKAVLVGRVDPRTLTP